MRISGQPSLIQPDRTLNEYRAGKSGGISGKSVLGRSVIHIESQSDKILNVLMEQRQKIIESKKELTENTINKGQSLESIKDRIKEMDKQIEQIDLQIMQQRRDEARKKLDDAKPSNDAPNGAEDSAGGGMARLLSLGNDFAQLSSVASVQGKMKGQAVVLKREIATDEARSVSGQSAMHKRGQLHKLNERLSALDAEAGRFIRDINSPAAPESPGDTHALPADGSGERARMVEAYRRINGNEAADIPSLVALI